MIKTKFLLLIAFVFMSYLGNAQETTTGIDGMRKNAVSFNILGASPLIGITYERVISENVSLEMGLGYSSIGAGMKYFPWEIKESKLLFHVGLTGTLFNGDILDFFGTHGTEYFPVVYFPVGISYFGARGFNLGVDVGPAILEEVIPYFNIKLGYRF